MEKANLSVQENSSDYKQGQSLKREWYIFAGRRRKIGKLLGECDVEHARCDMVFFRDGGNGSTLIYAALYITTNAGLPIFFPWR